MHVLFVVLTTLVVAAVAFLTVPIIYSPRRLAVSMKDVPRWGLILALTAAGGVLALEILFPIAVYILLGAFAIFAAGVLAADRRYQARLRAGRSGR